VRAKQKTEELKDKCKILMKLAHKQLKIDNQGFTKAKPWYELPH